MPEHCARHGVGCATAARSETALHIKWKIDRDELFLSLVGAVGEARSPSAIDVKQNALPTPLTRPGAALV